MKTNTIERLRIANTTDYNNTDATKLAVTLEPFTGLVTIPKSIGLKKAVRITLDYYRQNSSQAYIARYMHTSQPTVSRCIKQVTKLINLVLPNTPKLSDLRPDSSYIVDGTLCLCWSWRGEANRRLYSGKHKTTGHNLQIVVDLDGRIRYISPPLPGCRHDMRAARECGLVDYFTGCVIADRGYKGSGWMIPYIRKPGCKLTEYEKDFNRRLGRLRYVVEKAIAQLKAWKILHTDCRLPLNRIPETIQAITKLIFHTRR